MKILIYILLLLPISVFAETYYVQDTSENASASDSNTGTDIALPWATWQKAFNTAEAGDTVYFRGGVWYPDIDQTAYIIQFNPDGGYVNDGTYTDHIVFMNYPG
jgi:hypothetical protein